MPIDLPQGDLARAVSHDPDHDFPDVVELRVIWNTRGGESRERTIQISADQFFGRGGFGAPMSGDYVVQTIERLRRQGAPTGAQKRKRRGS